MMKGESILNIETQLFIEKQQRNEVEALAFLYYWADVRPQF